MRPLGVSLTFVVALTMISTQVTAQQQFKPVTSVNEVVFHYADLENFIKAMRAFAGQRDTTAIIQTYYFDRASPGIQEFIRENNVNAEDYLELMRKIPNHYGSLIGLPERLNSFEEDVRAGGPQPLLWGRRYAIKPDEAQMAIHAQHAVRYPVPYYTIDGLLLASEENRSFFERGEWRRGELNPILALRHKDLHRIVTKL